MKQDILMDSKDNSHLSTLLSKLAASFGVAIPIHRFNMISILAGGADIANLDLINKAQELWLTAVPGGDAEILKTKPEKTQLPLLWINLETELIGIVKGKLASGAYILEKADGLDENISEDLSAQGKFIKLSIDLATQERSNDFDRSSAKEFFYEAIKKRKGAFLESVIATFVMSMLALGVSFFTMQVYDRVVPSQNFSTLYVLAFGTVLAILFELVMKQTRSHLIDRACKAIDEELSSTFFGKLLSIRLDARPNAVGTLSSKIKNFEMVRNFMTSTTIFVLADLPFAIFFIFIIYIIGGPLAIVPIALIPISLLIGFSSKWRLHDLSREQQEDANEKNGLLVESIDGMEAIKAQGSEWKLLDRWKKITATSAEKELKIRSISMLNTSLTQTVQQISYISLISFGVYEITQGHITQGVVMACAIISNRALSPIASIPSVIIQWHHAKEALRFLDEIVKLPSERNPGQKMIIPQTLKGELILSDVSFSYEPKFSILSNVSAQIKPGERVAIVGPVGSSKSTFIKILSGLYKPTEGKVFLDGIDMSQIAPEFLREKIGYLPQDVRLFKGTLRDNLAMGLPSPSDDQLMAAAAKTGLIRLIRSHPKGLDLSIYEGGRGLSGGQKQVVGLTRLILAKPKILILDEPTASMDNDLELFIMKNIFHDLEIDSTIILVTHKIALLPLAKRVILFDQGRILADGSKEEVSAHIQAIREKLDKNKKINAKTENVSP
jgi:ATP-binding cassette subfamily C protein LapB